MARMFQRVALLLIAASSWVATATVTATYSAATGTLSIVGDALDNNIEVSRAADGRILINGGAVSISGGTATAGNTSRVFAFGLDGNDAIVFNEFNGALPGGVLLGGNGNDTIIGGSGRDQLLGSSGNDLLLGGSADDQLFGGSGNDTALGDRGNDRVFGQSGRDLIIWNNGDGSDLTEGGDDRDTQQINGANGAGDDFSVDPNGDRVRFQRNNLGLFTLDLGTVEDLDVNGQGGDDVIAGSVGLRDLIALDLDGGEGNDLLIGSDGVDVLRGGAGNDTLIGNKGNDVQLGETGSDLFVWNNGDGSDLSEGGTGSDTQQVNGADGAGDDFSVDPNGDRVRFQRNNLGLFALDLGTVENLDVNGQGGDDRFAGGSDLAGLIAVDFDGGAGSDQVLGSNGDDLLRGGLGLDLFAFAANPGNDSVTDFMAMDLLDVQGLLDTVLATPGQDLFQLGFLSAEVAGQDLRLLYTNTAFTDFMPFATLLGFTDPLGSLADNPFRIGISRTGVSEPGTLALLLLGAGLLRLKRARRR